MNEGDAPGGAGETGATRRLLVVERVSKAFAEGPRPTRALHDVSFTVADGEFVCLLGPSGSGKSTLLRIAGGLIAPDQGRVLFDGQPLQKPQPEIGFVFQSTNLMPWRTVLENVLLPLEIQGAAQAQDHTPRAVELLRVVGLEGFERVYPKHLSGGMAQRVVLARTLIQQPKLLLMDEPFGALDALTRERMNLELLRVQRIQAATVLMVTHSIPEAIFLADRVIVLSERPGRIIAEVIIDLARPRTMDMTASAQYGELAMEVRRHVGNAMVDVGM